PFNAVSVTHINAELTSFSSAEVKDVGDLDIPEIKTYILSFNYHAGNDTLSLNDKEVRKTYPDENNTDGTYRYEIISLSNTSIYSANFVDPYLVTDSVTLLERSLTPPEGFVINDTPIPDYPPQEAPSQEFVLITPFFFNAETINIYDENNTLQLSIDVSEFMSGDLTGVIKDPTGTPVVNAIVYAIQDNYNYSSSSYTNINGTYAMRGLGSGTASIRVTALHDPNLREASTSFTIVPGQRNLLNISLAQSSSISGIVTYINGTGMPNPILYLEYYEAPRYTGDENGSYLMPWLTQGAHTLNIDTGNWHIWINNDYTSYGRNTPINLPLGETTTVDFSQQPPPTFNSINTSPQYPNLNMAITVSSNITSEYVNITEAKLFYRYNNSAWNNLTMQNTGDIYSAAIPGNENTSRVSFYIAVTDSSERVRKSNVNHFIIDGENPTLADITIPQFADVNESITINANFQDNVGLAAATLYYKFDAGSFNPVTMTVVGNTSSGIIPQKNTPGTVELYIQSTDLSGNSFNTSSHYYIVKRFGRLEPYIIMPEANTPVSRSQLFNFSSGVRCVGG
ncbi:MAG: carboxypeptidase-like regulatory domain-containing protein, partial [Anaerolineales bacterium]|nr:carboxypeptidase-like regulatory domain-containing protein [Anaerolineales bacterium]